jgi:hypothetical protein
MPANTVKVDRTTRWGNFYCVGEPLNLKVARKWEFYKRDFREPERVCETTDEAVRRFASTILNAGWCPRMIQRELRGKHLACWCRLNEPCHADVLLEIANALDGDAP